MHDKLTITKWLKWKTTTFISYFSIPQLSKTFVRTSLVDSKITTKKPLLHKCTKNTLVDKFLLLFFISFTMYMCFKIHTQCVSRWTQSGGNAHSGAHTQSDVKAHLMNPCKFREKVWRNAPIK